MQGGTSDHGQCVCVSVGEPKWSFQQHLGLDYLHGPNLSKNYKLPTGLWLLNGEHSTNISQPRWLWGGGGEPGWGEGAPEGKIGRKGRVR